MVAPPTLASREADVTWNPRHVKLRSEWDGHEEDLVFVRQAGNGVPVLLLHCGWGYGVHAFDAIAAELAPRGFRCIAPDRTGYGRSSALDRLPIDFHRRAARETLALLDALCLRETILWGHSDGAVIAAWLAIQHPDRFPAVVLESFHFWAGKAASRTFFEAAARGGHELGERTRAALEADHGARWSDVVAMNGRVWIQLGETAPSSHADLYGGELGRIRAATLLLQGSGDPRTEVGEIDAAHGSIAGSRLVVVDGKHAPHSEPAAWAQAGQTVLAFLQRAADRFHDQRAHRP